MKPRIIIIIGLVFAFNCISLWSQAKLECENEVKELKESIANQKHKLESEKAALQRKLENCQKIECDTMKYLNQIESLKMQLLRYENESRESNFQLSKLNDLLNKETIANNLRTDSIKELKRTTEISNQEFMKQDETINSLTKEIKELKNQIDSLTALTPEEREKWEEIELEKIKQEREISKRKYDATMDSIININELKQKKAEERKIFELSEEKKELETETKRNNEKRQQAILAQENIRIDKEIQLAKSKSNLPEHLGFAIGGSTGWVYGTVENKQISFHLNQYCINLRLGYWLDSPYDGLNGTMIGLFSEFGTSNSNAIQNLIGADNPTKDYNPFWGIQAGILIKEIIYFGLGYGQQEINPSKSAQSFSTNKYLTTDLGIMIPIGDNFDIGLKSSFQLGFDYKDLNTKISLVSNVKLNFGKW